LVEIRRTYGAFSSATGMLPRTCGSDDGSAIAALRVHRARGIRAALAPYFNAQVSGVHALNRREHLSPGYGERNAWCRFGMGVRLPAGLSWCRAVRSESPNPWHLWWINSTRTRRFHILRRSFERDYVRKSRL